MTMTKSLFAPIDTNMLFEPDTLLPDQFYTTLKKSHFADPERRLMAAILEDAVWCLAKDARAAGRRQRTAFDDAVSWVNGGENQDWIFSFTNICEYLGLDPDYLRRGLSRWTAVRWAETTKPMLVKKYRSAPRQKRIRFRAVV